MLVEHVEYKDQLKLYEEIHCVDEIATMHGPAVASIAVGKTVGVAPESDLYYIAETHGVYNDEGEFYWDISWIAKSIDRIVEVNSILREGEKIRVISISLGIGEMLNGYEKVVESIEKAQKEGIYTVHVGSNGYLGLGRDPLKSADDITAYTKGAFWKETNYNNNELLVPMDSRCTASPTGPNDYVFYREGGMSWSVPYVAGLYALACQVNPDITPDVFWREALNTSETVPINNINQEKQLKNVNPARVRDNSNQYKLGKIVNPVKLIEKIASIK